jgi:CubicO group peptidase (beta-lactamase class C family)
MRTALLPLVALTLLEGSAHPADRLDRFVMSQMERRGISGVSLAIVDHGRIVAARGYGVTDPREDRRVDTATLFQAGSISKPVSAMAALHLVEQGRLELDADVNSTLKSWRLPPSDFTAKRPVTLRGLLSHTAGLTVHGFPGYDADSVTPTLVQVLDGAPPANTEPIRSESTPGTVWNYSGGGYTILQQMMIDATGQEFPVLMRQTVLAPLGMAHSSFEQPLPPRLAARTAAGHYADRSAVHARWHVYPEMAAAGLWTTPSDLARFAIGLQRGYTGRSNGVISPTMAKQMLAEQKQGFGLGLSVERGGKTLRFGHNGRDEGFDAMLVATAETGQAFVLMMNANDDSRFSSRVLEFVAREYGWPGGSEYPAPEAVAIAPAQLQAATGLFDGGDGGFVTLVARDRHLFTSVDGGIDEEFVPLGPDRFASTERDLRLGFERDASGAITAMTMTRRDGSDTLSRLGPLFRDDHSETPLEPGAAARADSVLRAMSQGGDAMRSVGGLAPGARSDFGTGAWPPVSGLTGVSCSGASRVSDGRVVRHGGQVARVGYCRVGTRNGERRVLVSFTSDTLVTDVDVVDE